ncbi:hypothetical protein VP01_2721g3 [Puccinia sorghi]|uniref:Uncharacterized protein n=1 Tax=Puccinia sorghi TaxID=27349 RepID=A0A0L6V3C4_9BASI|nr:hypothetical protein VP01_2721g3 [Puccinia sorghi]
MSDSKHIPVLTGKDFVDWKIKIRGYCLQHGLYDYLSLFAPTDIPTDTAPLKEHT